MAIGDAAPGATSAADLVLALDRLADRRLVLFGGKGGVGKTTLAALAALHFSERRDVVLFATDPSSNLRDLLGRGAPRVRIESVDATSLYQRFLEANLRMFLEIGDRGTYLDRDELRRFFELSLPGVDELMSWMRIGELAEESAEAIVVVDTAPTGHTLRMLASGSQFEQLAEALDALAEKRRAMVRQFARRNVRDAVDEFIADFMRQAERRRDLLADSSRTAFVPVTLSEPWVVAQTERLAGELSEAGLSIPFVILNRAVEQDDCERDRERVVADGETRSRFANVVDAPRSCTPLDSVDRLRGYLAGEAPEPDVELVATQAPHTKLPSLPRVVFFAGKGGVGKTTCAASVALQLAARQPSSKFVLISVDPAHAVRDVFRREDPPPNLVVETIDTRAKWKALRARLGGEIERAVDALTPGALAVSYDADAMKRLLDIGPPGADEIFAVSRLAELIGDQSVASVIVDTAPTGHFLRLLELPQSAGEWVRELMRLLLRYRDLVAPGALGEELVEASRALKELDATVRSDRAGVVVVTRPERIVIEETTRLISALEARGIATTATIANYLTPASDCGCDRRMRWWESAALRALHRVVPIERRDAPVVELSAIASLVPVA